MRLKIRVIWNKSGRLYENALSQWGWNLSRTRNCYCSTSKNGRMTKETIEKRMSSAVVVWFFFYATRNWNTSRIILKNAKCWGNRQIICGIVIKLKALNFQLFFLPAKLQRVADLASWWYIFLFIVIIYGFCRVAALWKTPFILRLRKTGKSIVAASAFGSKPGCCSLVITTDKKASHQGFWALSWNSIPTAGWIFLSH